MHTGVCMRAAVHVPIRTLKGIEISLHFQVLKIWITKINLGEIIAASFSVLIQTTSHFTRSVQFVCMFSLICRRTECQNNMCAHTIFCFFNLFKIINSLVYFLNEKVQKSKQFQIRPQKNPLFYGRTDLAGSFFFFF